MSAWHTVFFAAFSLFSIYTLAVGYYEWLLVIAIIFVVVFLRYAR